MTDAAATFTHTGDINGSGELTVKTADGDITVNSTLTSSNKVTLNAGTAAVIVDVNITSSVVRTLTVGGQDAIITGLVNRQRGAQGNALISILSGTTGTFNGAALTGPIDFSAVSNVTSVVTPPPAPGGGIAASTPADAAFCSDIAACGVVVDVFGTDYSLVEAGGGSESEYVASPFVTEGFWEQLLEDAEE